LKQAWMIALCGLALVAATMPVDAPPVDPAGAIALADQARKGEAAGLFRMTVAAVGDGRIVVYLNSNADYRSAGNLTFTLSKSVAQELLRRSVLADKEALIGRTVVVAGRIEKRPIVNVGADGRTMGFNRWGYSVRITKSNQLVSISTN
jgi:hypothetical protein